MVSPPVLLLDLKITTKKGSKSRFQKHKKGSDRRESHLYLFI